LSQDQTLQQVGSRSGSATTSRRSFSSAVIFDPAASVRLRLSPVILARCDPAAGLHPRPDRRIDEPPERLLLTTIQLLRFSLRRLRAVPFPGARSIVPLPARPVKDRASLVAGALAPPGHRSTRPP